MNYKIKQHLKRFYKDSTFLSMRNTAQVSSSTATGGEGEGL